APKDDDAAPPPPPVVTRAAVSEGPSAVRVASLGLMGAGVVALGVGVALGVLSFIDRNAVNNATRNSAGVVTGIKQTDAYSLDATVRWAAPAANVLFAVGGALAVGGLALFLLSPS